MAHEDCPVRVKICGITRAEDARAAVAAGAHALGFVFHEPSPRYLSPEKAAAIIKTLPPFVSTVGVFVNLAQAEIERIAKRAGLHVIQLHGDESPEQCLGYTRPVIKGFRFHETRTVRDLNAYQVSGFLIDAKVAGQWGGTGVPLDWELLSRDLDAGPKAVRGRLLLAGGLNAANVGTAIRTVNPFAVDVSTGVEEEPGIKNDNKIKEFMHAVRTAGNTRNLA